MPFIQQYGNVDVFLSGSNSSLPMPFPVKYKSNGLSLFYGNTGGLDYFKIAKAFNRAIKKGKIGPIVLGRDHHDVSGTDSPYRETSNIYDGSRFTADMAIKYSPAAA